MTDVADLESADGVVVENPKRIILEELFGEIHEFADGRYAFNTGVMSS